MNTISRTSFFLSFCSWATFCSPLEDKLTSDLLQNKIKRFIKCETIIDKNTQERLTKSVRYMCGEIAMYNASRFLELNIVPPAVLLKSKNADGKESVSFCSQWIDQGIQISDSMHLKKTISIEEWESMNIAQFLFGQYDRHFGNLIIQKDTNKLHLIDNEAIANVDQFVFAYSPDKKKSCPWVGNVGDFVACVKIDPDKEPKDFESVLNIAQDPAIMHAAFPHVDIWTKIDIDNGYCRIWHNRLWRQFYASSKEPGAPFSETISSDLLRKIKKLTPEQLASFWPAIPFEMEKEGLNQYKELIDAFVKKTMQRKQMILDYFDKHPEAIRLP
ncbi:MAG TPA: hypothetical protein VHO47_00695 [Candidatus Babeliales bacterium]|nr:hypothetical protein [Candidatus Babeliales bacterium]